MTASIHALFTGQTSVAFKCIYFALMTGIGARGSCERSKFKCRLMCADVQKAVQSVLREQMIDMHRAVATMTSLY